MIFLVSLLLLAWSSLRLSTRLTHSPAEGFWVFIASAMLQIGTITGLTSLVHQLHPGAWLAAQVCLCALILRFTRGTHHPAPYSPAIVWRRLRPETLEFVAGPSPWASMALVAIIAILVLSAVIQIATPIHAGDEKMYHASRVLYWIEHQTVLPFVSHNIRQTLTPFGSELLFLWPVLLTKTEAVGRLVFWLAYPLAATGQYLLLRSLKLHRTIALVGVLILISTPLVASSAIGLKPEIWSVLTLLGVAYWLVSITLSPRGMTRKYFFLGVFAILSISIRAFPVAIVPGLVLLVFWTRSRFPVLTRLKFLAAGLVCGGVMSSFVLLLASNFAIYHHPLGPPDVQRFVKADITPQVIFTHAVRFTFVLLELPDVPVTPETRSALNGAATRFISAIGAGVPLAGESEEPWPGKFVYSLPERSTRFSLWGLLWIPSLCIAILLLARNLVVTWPRVRLAAVPAQTLLVVPLFAAILFGARWMSHSDVPARFLIGPYALLLPIGIAIFAPCFAARKFAQPLVAIVILYAVYPTIRTQAGNALETLVSPVSTTAINQPFEEPLGLMQPGSRIIFVGEQSAPDYPLFSPGTHYANAVIPWGNLPFDPARMRQLIETRQATHVLIQRDEGVSFLDAPTLNTGKIVRWLDQEPGMKAIPLITPHMRLFSVGKSPVLNERALQTAEMPATAPLITIDTALHNQVGIDPALPRTPWPIENFGGTEGSFLWVGQGQTEGIAFSLWSRQARTVDLRFDALPGPSLWTPERRVMLVHNGVPVDDERTLDSDAPMVFHIPLHAGRNVFNFFALDAPTVKRMPNGDARNLVVGLHSIRVEAGQTSGGSVAPAMSPTSPSPPPPVPNNPRNRDLAESARVAADMIRSRQQIEGYWLTYYTSVERFETPGQEMNTFITAMMVDLLGAESVPAGLAGNLARARTHLRNQIEPTGLVRYHGRPDAPTIGTLGCAITPDADDTALAWRIAPGTQALRPSALATLDQYRTADGLYKTWLAQRADYQCIDPGSDPNPTDVAIQMHVLMLLAQTDPASARSLCSVLRQAIDQDRIWVYYRKSPLIPLLRQADLRAAGCPLQVPASRSNTTIPEQEIWLAAARMLQRLQDSQGPLPSPDEAVALLRKLSSDDFSLLRLTPPMFYHNDLTASVRRFYWSKDLGYAIWLRLYSESLQRGLLDSGRVVGNAVRPSSAARK